MRNVIHPNCKMKERILNPKNLNGEISINAQREANQSYSQSYAYDLFPGLYDAPPLILSPIPTV